ncbi:Trihelix transcription factor ASIL2 [Linum grandiflorum]
MSTPSPSSSSPPPNPPQSSSTPYSPAPIAGKKPQPVPWTHQQTVHLIQAYQEKWYGLNRGQLKATHWEEVAAAVVSRCGHNGYQPLKSSTQCRHKMDKLRKRFREEKRRAIASSFGGFVPSSTWPYFRLMEALERGSESESEAAEDGEEEEEEEVEEEEEGSGYRSRSRSINYIIRQPSSSNGFGGSDYSGSFAGKKKRKRGGGGGGMGKKNGTAAAMVLAEEIRSFAGKMLGMEKKKIEMVKEMEKMRMEMENKRMVMILDAEKRIIQSIQTAFGTQEVEEEEDDEK